MVSGVKSLRGIRIIHAFIIAQIKIKINNKGEILLWQKENGVRWQTSSAAK